MGEDFYVCCACEGCTSDYQLYTSCDGCGASFCCKTCAEGCIEPTQDGEKYCIDCASFDDIKQWIKDGHLNITLTRQIYKNAIDKSNKKIESIKKELNEYKQMYKLLNKKISPH